MIKTGLIGIGKMGLSHLAIFNAHKDVDVVAVCDPSKLMRIGVEKYLDMKVYKDYKTMIDENKLDCVVIATPTKFHYEMVEYALNHGVNTFCEKPFCLNPEDGKKLAKLAKEKQLINQVGYHCRFVGAFQKAKELLNQEVIGKPYYFKMEVYGNVVKKKQGKTWRSIKSEGGGCLYDYAPHGLDLVNYLLGQAESVSGTVFKSINSQNIEDAVYSTLYYDDQLSGQLSVNWCDETYRKMFNQITILGPNGKIIADRQECKLYVNDAGNHNKVEPGWNIFYTTDVTEPVDFYLRGEEYSAQVEHFIDCIKNTSVKNMCTFEEAQKADAVVAMLIEDVNKGRA
jgi:predicted dehydrogenase